MSKLAKLASDPEMFAQSLETGRLTSVAGMLGADKHNKKSLTDDVRIQEDNVLVEFDINPHSNFEDFNVNMQLGVDLCRKEVAKIGQDVAVGISSHIFSAEELQSFHKSAFEFGCEPDYNALTGMRNPKPAAADAGLRTAGGHIHFGYDQHQPVDTDSQKILGVMCDYFLGLPAMLIDEDDRRRELYGKAGACRFKPYGIEYRTLSNFWVFEEAKRQWAWAQAQKAYESMSSGQFSELILIVSPEDVQRVINNNDRKMAEQLVFRLEVA